MATLVYAGIGARATPAPVLADMTVMAGWLARTGWHLASGGAHGADGAFECVRVSARHRLISIRPDVRMTVSMSGSDRSPRAEG